MIRSMNENDRNDFVKLADEFYHSSAVLHTIPTENFHTTFDAILAQNPYAKGYAFEVDGCIAGYALLSFTYSNEAGGLCCLVDEVYVLPRYQGCGLGRELFSFVETEFSDVKRFRLEVTHCNERAIALYKRLGYEEIEYLQMIKER